MGREPAKRVFLQKKACISLARKQTYNKAPACTFSRKLSSKKTDTAGPGRRRRRRRRRRNFPGRLIIISRCCEKRSTHGGGLAARLNAPNCSLARVSNSWVLIAG
jgi:hypothetical protein